MADALISRLLDLLKSTAYEYIKDEVKLVLNAKKDVDNFACNLKAIQAVLEDAEQKQVTDANVRTWLADLTDISYQMVDVLDEWNTEILKQQVENQETEGDQKVCSSIFPCCSCLAIFPGCSCLAIFPGCSCFGQVSRVIFRCKIAATIKDLNERLTQIHEQKEKFNFQSTEKGIEIERKITSSFVDTSELFGREDEKDNLIKMLRDSSDKGRGLLIIPIVGMGGMGKTTLAQLAYNDDNVKAHFEMRIWVCVSDPFDVVKIAKAIISVAEKNNPYSDELDRFLQRLSESVKEKKFLLVLDDVWTEDRKKWEHLSVPLIQSGGKGSRILVTTRKHEVAEMMRATAHMINLTELNEEYCLSIFNHMAFSEREVDESMMFPDISKEIIKKCKGLPLAAKTLGSLMRNKTERREWKDVLNSKIWDLKEMEQEVFQPLLLSYYDLALIDKCCLLYCAIFPKDHEFEREYLINLWMTQDYLNSKENKDNRKICRRSFDNLIARSFFQDFRLPNDSGKLIGYKMHDIVHDFVQFLTKKECLIVEAKGASIEVGAELGDKVRHLTLTNFKSDGNGPLPLSNISSVNCKNLRTLATFDSIITSIDSNLILHLKCVRTLNLSWNWMKEVPKEIGELIHLRHIDLSFNDYLEKLPESICDLVNLCTLSILYCGRLQKLPDKMGKLISLKHLYVAGCDNLEYMPKGIGRLKSLETLDKCRMFWGDNDEEEALQIGDLRNLINLQGSLWIKIKLVGEVKDESEVEEVQFINQLFHLQLDAPRSSVNMNALRPHQDLESLDISGHSGSTWPNWMTSLHNLRFLTVYGWDNCEVLPPLGKLPSLERLTIYGISGVKKVGAEFLGIEEDDSITSSSSSSSSFSSVILFPKLKHLEFKEMPLWVEWEGVGERRKKEDSDSDEITIMPRLSSLEILDCDSLNTLPDFLFKTPLQNLEVYYCRRLSQRYKQGIGKEWPKISHIPNIKVVAY